MKKKNLLLVSYKIPYPLSQGGAVAQFFFLKKLSEFFNVSFCTLISNENQAKNLEIFKKIFPEIVIKAHKSNNSYRKKTIVESIFKFLEKWNKRILKKLEYIFIQDNKISTINYLDESFEYGKEEFVNFFKGVLEKDQYDIIQLEFFETLALLPLIPRAIKKIVVHHEIRSKRNSLLNIENIFYKNYIEKISYTIEKSLLSMADSVIVFNKDDENYLNEIDSNIKVSPFGIPNDLIVKKEPSSFFNKFIFVGSEFHFPNKEGLEWFLDLVYIPNIETIDWPIHITGFWNHSFKQKYKVYDKIFFTGFVQNLADIYENAVLIAPILSGSGVRTKILEAFSNKIPVISTIFASEGLYQKGEEHNHIIHFDSTMSFLTEIESIKKNPDLLVNIANNGFKYFTSYFNEDILFEKRLSIYLN